MPAIGSFCTFGTGLKLQRAILPAFSSVLADYKLPEELLSAPEIPRNGLGKIDRARLLKML
jgi:acyl-CoA synthetase (AMP-forming)/AMP-acid ligase II